MLRERTIRLVAAFDHRDIFIDPVPDPEKSLAERQRLFDLPRSSWQDYNRALISPAAASSRAASRRIKLSPQAQKLIGLDGATHQSATIDERHPQDADRPALVRRHRDLRAGSSETDDAAGDRANDPIRGDRRRAQVQGDREGANLA